MSDWWQQPAAVRGMELPADLVAELDDATLVAALHGAPVADRSILMVEIIRRGLKT